MSAQKLQSNIIEIIWIVFEITINGKDYSYHLKHKHFLNQYILYFILILHILYITFILKAGRISHPEAHPTKVCDSHSSHRIEVGPNYSAITCHPSGYVPAGSSTGSGTRTWIHFNVGCRHHKKLIKWEAKRTFPKINF